MTKELHEQEKFWDREINNFDSIYSHKKGAFENWLDRTFRWDMYERYKYTLEQCEPVKGRTFLDVGCGTGQYSLELARRNASLVCGLDISSNMKLIKDLA